MIDQEAAKKKTARDLCWVKGSRIFKAYRKIFGPQGEEETLSMHADS